jgi:hypothetical protein
MHAQTLDTVPLWALFLLITVCLAAAIEGGYWLGRARRARSADEKEQPVGAMVASILGLVALVLGFTFSLAASRFDARRTAVLEEANAIGTTYLRASFLPQPQRSEVENLLREYAETRLKGTSGGSPEEEIARSEAIQVELWKLASGVAEKNPQSITVGLFIQTLNDLIDLHAKRVLVGMRSRIPVVIWIGVYGMALLGMAAVGYLSGLSATRRSPVMGALILSFSIVLILIADLDRGQEGLLRIGQQAMVDVQKSMQP